MVEEVGIEYEVHPVHIGEGDQFEPAFLAINPNNKVPAIVDDEGPGGQPYSVFESGAILLYLAEKTGKLLPRDAAQRYDVIQWLMFQMGNVGPMFGQNGYFNGYADEDVPHAKKRYINETKRIYGVMNKRLAKVEYLAGDEYSIADVATYPWTVPRQQAFHSIDIAEFPNVGRWVEQVSERPAVQRGVAVQAAEQTVGEPTKEAREALFGDRQIQQR